MPPEQNTSILVGNRKILALGLVALLGIGTLVYFFWEGKKEEEEVRKTSPYSRLLSQGEAFREGEKALREDQDYSRAILKFTEAVNEARYPDEESLAKLKLAAAFNRNNDKKESIRILKEIIADESYPARTRANAVDYLARLFLSEGDTSLFPLIFEGEPYATFLVSGDGRKSMEYLYEYGSSLYPIADVELRLAEFYTQDIRDLRLKPGAEAEEKALIQLVEDKIKSADQDIPRLRIIQSDDFSLYRVLGRRAFILSRLDLLEYDSFQPAEPAFLELLAEIKGLNNPQEIWIRYDYARYLAMKYGIERARQVQELLPLTLLEEEGMKAYFRNLRTANLESSRQAEREDIDAVVVLHPIFKRYLQELGWTF